MIKEGKPRRVILVTDGDPVAQKAVEEATRNIGGRCISASAGNPTPVSGERLVKLIKTAKYDPVVVMFDDRGSSNKGQGERALEFVAKHPEIDVMGVLAVASNTEYIDGARVDLAITKRKQVIEGQVDKEGKIISSQKLILGDTVDVLNEIKDQIPIVIGIGDIGKMDGKDNPYGGAQVTTKALKIIMDHWQAEHDEGQTIT